MEPPNSRVSARRQRRAAFISTFPTSRRPIDNHWEKTAKKAGISRFSPSGERPFDDPAASYVLADRVGDVLAAQKTHRHPDARVRASARVVDPIEPRRSLAGPEGAGLCQGVCEPQRAPVRLVEPRRELGDARRLLDDDPAAEVDAGVLVKRVEDLPPERLATLRGVIEPRREGDEDDDRLVAVGCDRLDPFATGRSRRTRASPASGGP